LIYVLYFTSQGAPKTGLTPTIITLNKISDGAAVAVTPSAWPTVSEIAGGGYKFTLAFPFNSLSESLFAVIDGGATLVNTERYKVMQLTVNDASLDAAVSTRAPEAGGNLAAVKADVEHATYGLNALLTAIGTRMATFTYTAPDSAATIAAAVWNYLTASMTTLNSIGKKLADWVVGTIETYTGNTKQTGDAFALLGTIRGTDNDTLKTLSEQLDVAQTDLDNPSQYKATGFATPTNVSDAQTAIIAALPSVAALALEANVQGHVADALTAYDPPTRAEATADKAEIEVLVEKIRKAVSNRLVVNPTTGGYIIYADDGTTPLITGTISGTGRSAPTWL